MRLRAEMPGREVALLKIYSKARVLATASVSGSTEVTISLKAEDLYEDGSAEIFLRSTPLCSPQFHGSSDCRHLGVGLESISLTPLGESLEQPSERQLPVPPRVTPDAILRKIGIKRPLFQLDTLDGRDVSRTKTVDLLGLEFRSVVLRGWAASSRRKPYDRVEIELVGAKTYTIAEPTAEPRPDLVAAFGSDEMVRSGFRFVFPPKIAVGRYDVRLLAYSAHKMVRIDVGYTLTVS